MKTKLILFTSVIAAAIIGGLFLFSGFKKASPKDAAKVKILLDNICRQANDYSDSIALNFDMPKDTGKVNLLVQMLSGPNVLEKDIYPDFQLELQAPRTVKQAGAKTFGTELIATLSRDSLAKKSLPIPVTIGENKAGELKIISFDVEEFNRGYREYQQLVKKERMSDEAIYSAATLAAFKTAKLLHARGDSVVLFQHVKGQTYYFITDGKGNPLFMPDFSDEKQPIAKMGMVAPSLKVIIPAVYTLVHNIGATFPGLVEVENGARRGFYDLAGKMVLPVVYDEVLPVNDKKNMAVLRKGNAYLWWKKDGTVSLPDATVKIAELLPRIQTFGRSFDLDEKYEQPTAEYNSKDEHAAIFFPPSYLVDWQVRNMTENYRNPQRKYVYVNNGTSLSTVKYSGPAEKQNWFMAFFYSITDHFIGGREGFYGHKSVVLANKKRNRVYSGSLLVDYSFDNGGNLTGICDVYNARPVNDTLYEIKFGAQMTIPLYNGDTVVAGPKYCYLVFKNDKLVEKPLGRRFAFTHVVKMDDSYLNGCYLLGAKKKKIDALTPEILTYIKNEIYAGYGYRFKDKKWADMFNQGIAADLNDNVTDSLTAIEKYNIAFINQKLKALQQPKLLAAK